MRDQADKLRQMVDNLKTNQDFIQTNFCPLKKKKTAKVITVTIGKGGVGKTNVAVNLAIALSELGQRVTILDADFGLSNIDVLFGIIPKFTLLDVIRKEKNIIEVLSDGPQNIKFISGGSGVEELVRLDTQHLERFVEDIVLLDEISDIILIDTGAGLAESVMSFVMAADEIFLVTTPEPTSITDAYALVKMVANKDKSKIIRLIVNRAENYKEAGEILSKLAAVAQKFLNIKINQLGYVTNDDLVMKSVKQQQPFSLNYPKSQAARDIRNIAQKVTEDTDLGSQAQNFGIKGFVSKLVNFLGN